MDENPIDAVVENTDEVVIEDTTNGVEDVEALKERLAQVEKAKHDLSARAKKAEAELKSLREKSADAPQKEIIKNTLSEADVEAKILRAQGVSTELLDELKVIARARGKSLIEAQEDPLFVLRKKQMEDEAKAQKAKLPSSKGSGSVKHEKTFNTSGLSNDEHRAMWKAQQG